MSGNHKVKSYKIFLYRSGDEIFELENTGGKIEYSNYEKIKKAKHNDVLAFKDIYAYIVGEESARKLNDITIRIVN